MMMQATPSAGGVSSAESARGPSAAELIDSFEKSAGLNERIGILRQLAIVGKAESVPLLTKLLDHEEQPIREYALAAAEANPAPAAGAALVAALGKANDATWKVAVINALGGRREPTAVGPLAKLINDGDPSVSAAAIAALGTIRTPQAGHELGKAIARLKQGQATSDGQAPADKKDVERMAMQVVSALLTCIWNNPAVHAPSLYRSAAYGWPGPGSPGWDEQPAELSHLFLAAVRGMTKVGDNGKAFGPIINYLTKGTPLEQAEAARLLIDFTDNDRVFPGHAAHPTVNIQQKVIDLLPKLPPTAQAFVLEALAEREAKGLGR